jgi:hypothetical protein
MPRGMMERGERQVAAAVMVRSRGHRPPTWTTTSRHCSCTRCRIGLLAGGSTGARLLGHAIGTMSQIRRLSRWEMAGAGEVLRRAQGAPPAGSGRCGCRAVVRRRGSSWMQASPVRRAEPAAGGMQSRRGRHPSRVVAPAGGGRSGSRGSTRAYRVVTPQPQQTTLSC